MKDKNQNTKLEKIDTCASEEHYKNSPDSAALLRYIVESVPVRIFWKDIHLRFLGCNTLFANDAGLSSPKELIGKDDLQMSWKEQAERYNADDQQVIASGLAKINYEERQTTPTGHQIWLRTSKVPLFNADGSPLGILGICDDITAQKEMQIEQLEYNKKLTNIAGNVPGVIYTYQQFQDGRSCFPYASEHIYDIYGVSPEEIKEDATKVFGVVYPEDLPHVAKTIQISFEELTLWEDEYRVIHPDKGIIWVKGMANPEKQSDGSVVWHGYIYDITIRKELEKELKLKEKMMLTQSKQAAMGDMLSMIAHQWRQPLAVIGMEANNLRASIELEEEITTDYLLEYADNVSTQVQDLSKIIEDFKNFFKSDQAKEQITVEDVLNCTLSIIGTSLKNNNITVIIKNSSKSSLFTNKSSLIQVLLNLVGNAKEVLLEKEVAQATINITVNETTETITLSICDNGGGISKDIMDKLGQPYFTTKQKLNGTGLGLYISKTIAEKHLNGTLTWHNEEQGACFVITLKI